MLQTAYSDSAIVEFSKKKIKPSDFGGVDCTSPQTESLSFTNHKRKCNAFISMSPKTRGGNCLILATPMGSGVTSPQWRTQTYITFTVVSHTQGAHVQISFYPQITPFLPLPRKRSPDGTSQDSDGRHLTTHLSTRNK